MVDKNECLSCGDSLYVVGPIRGPKQGEEYLCMNEDCDYSEHRYYDEAHVSG